MRPKWKKYIFDNFNQDFYNTTIKVRVIYKADHQSYDRAKTYMIGQNLFAWSSWSHYTFFHDIVAQWSRTLIGQNGTWYSKNCVFDHQDQHFNFLINNPDLPILPEEHL